MTESKSQSQGAPAKTKPTRTYQQVLAKAKSLVDGNKLTHAWISEKLQAEDKKPKDFSESELSALDAELDKFIDEFKAAQAQ
jgi:hypothetical protein